MTTNARKGAPRPMPVKTHLGVPAGRLLELQLETTLPQPYVISDTITVLPPTKARADKIREAQMTIMVYNSLLGEAIKSEGATEDLLNGLTKYVREAERSYNEAFFGDCYDDVVRFFAAQDDRLWQVFERDIQKQFFPNQPVDGKCQMCGQVVDEDAAGKAPPSSPSSSTGGTS